MHSNVDINEQKILETHPRLLDVLLLDRTTGHNIIWGTDDYINFGDAYESHYPITKELISGFRTNIIQPRVVKSKEQQGYRTKGKAEVFTPIWICNEQNNLVDDAWFGRPEVFNIPGHKGWKSTTDKIKFPDDKRKTWQKYVDERRLEIACGEAPYLVSRYDPTTGVTIKLKDRIGLLDRKMRIVSENTDTELDWLKWAERAYQSVYGFEFQGDNLLLARENLLYSYSDYMESHLRRQPTEKEFLNIARIISWNLWQMDALTMTIPYQVVNRRNDQISFLEDQVDSGVVSYCKIKDWRSKKIIKFIQLVKEVQNNE
jgi:hypothetical protein